MERERFDPFGDRQARLLRNAMAGSLAAALRARDPRLFRQEGGERLARSRDPVHRAYLADRLRRYEEAFQVIERQGTADPFAQALILWNHGLFYEVHELLEPLWRQSTGSRRCALQAMIRAAGVYVHLAAGNRRAAAAMAAKAAAALRISGSALPLFGELDRLLSGLGDLDRIPLTLRP